MRNSQTYPKSFAIKSIMSNPKLASVLFDSWEAPVGSTKAARAKSVMKSLERSANKYAMDGRGGPGIQQPWTNSLLTQINPSFGAMSSAFNTPTGNSAAQNPLMSIAKQSSPQATPQVPSSNIGVPDTFPVSTQKFGTDMATTPRSTLFLKTIDDFATPGSPAEAAYKDTTGHPQQGQAADTATVSNVSDTSSAYGQNVSESYQDILTKYGISTKPEGTADYLSDVLKATEAGVGEKTFATQALADKDMLAKILQLPKETLDWLPDSGFLSDYLSDLKQETKDRYQIDNQLDRILKLENRGLTIEQDLQAYIRGKDTYLGKLDKLFEDATQKMAYMDTSDPSDARRMNNYLNYLTILKGRQNQRYIDFLNTSVKTHENELNRAANLYKYTKEQFDEDFADLKEGATEKYGRLQDMLEEMYTNVSKREETAYNDEKRQLDLISSAYNIEESIINLQKKKDELSGTILPDDFYTYTNTLVNELQTGEDWGSIWRKVKQRYPNASNEAIDTALGGGIVATEAEAKTKDPNNTPMQVDGGWAWGWARPGAFQGSKPTTQNVPKEKMVATVSLLLSTPKETDLGGVTGWKGLSDKEICDNIFASGITPKDIDTATDGTTSWATTCGSFLAQTSEE